MILRCDTVNILSEWLQRYFVDGYRSWVWKSDLKEKNDSKSSWLCLSPGRRLSGEVEGRFWLRELVHAGQRDLDKYSWKHQQILSDYLNKYFFLNMIVFPNQMGVGSSLKLVWQRQSDWDLSWLTINLQQLVFLIQFGLILGFHVLQFFSTAGALVVITV